MNLLKENNLPFSLGDLESSNYIWLTLTNLCNIHCKYCFNYISRSHEFMPATRAIDIIKSQINSLRPENSSLFSIVYFGGEPTLNQDALLQSIDFLIDNDINAHQLLITNGIFNDNLFTKLVDKNIDFQVSFDGEENDVRLNKTMTTFVHDKTVRMIKKLADANEIVTIRGTIHHDNVKNIVDLVRFCINNQVKKLHIEPICDFGETKTFQVKQPDINEYADNFSMGFELAQQYGINFTVLGKKYFMDCNNKKMNIPLIWLPDGKVAMTITYASSKIKDAEKVIIGELNETNGLIELNETRIQEMKENFLRNRKKYCSECVIKDICCGIRHLSAFATNTFNPQRDRYFCNLAIEMVKRFPD